jgi:hypothetical protein
MESAKPEEAHLLTYLNLRRVCQRNHNSLKARLTPEFVVGNWLMQGEMIPLEPTILRAGLSTCFSVQLRVDLHDRK